MLIWDDSMSTGLSNIDDQHKEIIEKYNELSAALAQGSAAGRVVTGELLDFLQFYSKWHFEREEECMDHYQCPAAAANKEAHAQFIELFGHFYEQWQQSDVDTDLVYNTFTELGDWITNHIMRIDSQLRPCVKDSDPGC